MQLLEPLPDGVVFQKKVSRLTSIVHVFCDRKKILKRELAALRRTLKSDGAVWVSWPKKTSGVPTQITGDTIRELALPLGFVDIKVQRGIMASPLASDRWIVRGIR